MDDLLQEFLTETSENLELVDTELVKFEREPNNAEILNNIFRVVHTIKGTCGFIGLPRLASLAHAAENLMDQFRSGRPVTSEAVGVVLHTMDRIKLIVSELESGDGSEPDGDDADLITRLEALTAGEDASADEGASLASADTNHQLETPIEPVDEAEPADAATTLAEAGEQGEAAAQQGVDATQSGPTGSKSRVGAQTIRVRVDALEHLMTIVSELVLTRNQLLEIVRRSEDSEYKLPLQRLSTVTGELQQAVMNTRMQPIGNAWQQVPRLVRDLSQDLGKTIDLVMSGADTELDRQVLDVVKDPLTHLVRNCADHGLESPADRRRAGKSETGTIRLSAYHEGGHIIIEIGDDGRGIDVDKIKAKAIANGLVTEAEAAQLTDVQAFRFIFHPGFSTAASVTSVSGRGVGMDVVRSNIEAIGGSVDVRSTRGKGSIFFIRIPLTLAILTALIVEAEGEQFAFPQIAVNELVRLDSASEHRIERVNGAPVLRLRHQLLPVMSLAQLLGLSDGRAREPDDGCEGFVVIMQAGSVRFGILVDSVLHMEEIVVKPLSSMLRGVELFSGSTILGDGRVIMIVDPNGVGKAIASLAETAVDAALDNDESTTEGPRETQSLLLFRAGSKDPKAVPVGLVTRIEDVKAKSIEMANGTPVMQYRGDLVPLVYFDENVRRMQEGSQPVLVFSDNGRSMGLVVDEIVDIIEDHVDVQLPSESDGIVGTAVLAGRATEILDVGHVLSLAFADWFVPTVKHKGDERGSLILVDDSAFFRGLIEPVLTGSGYRVSVYASAKEALEALRHGERCDVIVSDIEMPEMDGFALAQAINDNDALSSIPIIALSGICTPEAIERGRAAGFSDYVAKFDRSGLIAAIGEFCGRNTDEADLRSIQRSEAA